MSAEGGRFRVNVYRKETGIGATFRSIPTDVPTLDKLALPPIVKKLCDYHQGMVLVTGSTGTGKSTTLAAMIDHLNTTRRLNIISLEDPIEFVHRSKNSQVIQRELGTHIPSFAEGVRAAMREDPDVILVGELRDAETISMAMTAAETGHLVLGTLHTTGAVKTIDRIIDALPVEEREQTKSFLSQSLLAVVTQMLVKTADSRGRKAICEVMVMTKAIAKLIQTDQTHQIPTQLQMGRDLGMQLLDQALLDCDHGARKSTRTTPTPTPATSAPFQKLRDRHQRAAEARRDRAPRRRPASGRRKSTPVAAIDAYLKDVLRRSGSDLHFIAGDPPRIRLYGDLQPLRPGAARRRIREGDALRDHAEDRGRSLRGARTARTSPTPGRARALPRQRDAPAERHGRGVPRHPVQGADARCSSSCRKRCGRCAAPTMGSSW